LLTESSVRLPEFRSSIPTIGHSPILEAHQWSPEADLGAKKHLANTEGLEILSEREREDCEICQRKREEFISAWLGNSQEPFSSIKEQRLWLRKGIRPLLTGKPDEVLRQGTKCAVIDFKFGNCRVTDPVDNVQLSIYALVPGDMRRSIEDCPKVYAQLAELFSLEEFLDCCSVSVPELERSWARKKGLPANQTKELFKKFLGPFLVEKRNAPSLKPV
jgi:hypothetical protein